ncbi:glycosyltransferase [Rhodobacterales bacterium HKCCA1058]|nr:glycosyltransferase [Rhodobacterales bacterium HKCCA1058]
MCTKKTSFLKDKFCVRHELIATTAASSINNASFTVENVNLISDNDPLISDLKITVATVVFNGVDVLERTILSVKNQTYSNIEFIIIDGGSTDGTLEIIKKYDFLIDYWVSEDDEGIYDAMNKAEALSTGHFINFLNAGDVYYNKDTINHVVKNISESCSLIYGDVVLVGEGYEGYAKAKKFTFINLVIWGTRVFCHQSVFLRRTIFPKYSTDYKLKSEFNWYFDLLSKGVNAKMLPMPICAYSLGGASDRLFRLEVVETVQVLIRRCGFLSVLHLPILIFKLVKRFMK